MEQTKKCPECGSTKPRSEFNRNASKYDGLQGKCRSCERASDILRYQVEKEKRSVARKARYALNPALEMARNRRWHKKNVDNINYRLSLVLRGRLKGVIKSQNARKTSSAVRDLGCTIPELRVRLESLFCPGMTWGNYGYRGWHIDHIRPLSSFDLTDPEQQRLACHYTNLQPLWAAENLAKSDNYTEKK
jgi:hypothetical protein